MHQFGVGLGVLGEQGGEGNHAEFSARSGASSGNWTDWKWSSNSIASPRNLNRLKNFPSHAIESSSDRLSLPSRCFSSSLSYLSLLPFYLSAQIVLPSLVFIAVYLRSYRITSSSKFTLCLSQSSSSFPCSPVLIAIIFFSVVMTKAENLHHIDIKIMRRAYHQNIRHFSKCQCVDSCVDRLELDAYRRCIHLS